MMGMSIIDEKKLETVPVKFSKSQKNELQQIAKAEDRGVGYIVRELAMRGLTQYKRDGQLKVSQQEEAAFSGEKLSPNSNTRMKAPKNKNDKDSKVA